jgi:hypothetical protein
MPKLRMSRDVRELNSGLISELVLWKKETVDKAQLFENAWNQYFGDYSPTPTYEREFHFNKPHSRHRADFCWKDKKLVVEIDGGEWLPYGGRHSHNADKIKMNLLAELGYRVMHFSPTMLEVDPNGCILSVIRALNYGTD